MAKKPLRALPHEQPGSPWPSLQVNSQDRRYLPVPETPLARQWRIARASFDLLLLDMGLASFKGALFGIFTFAIIFSFVNLRISGFCWLIGWHWAMAIGAILLSLLLIGLDWTLLLIGGVAVFLSLTTIITRPILALGFIGCGMVLWLLLEFWPQRRPWRIRGKRRRSMKRKVTANRASNGKSQSPGTSPN